MPLIEKPTNKRLIMVLVTLTYLLPPSAFLIETEVSRSNSIKA